MQQKMDNLKKWMIIALVIQAVLLFIFRAGLKEGILTASLVLIVEAFMLFLSYDRFDTLSKESATTISEVIGSAAEDAFLFGETGIVIYDDSHIITWMSELFQKRGIERTGVKILSWLPEAEPLLSGQSDRTAVQLDDRIYEISKKEDQPVLFFRDITDETRSARQLEESRPVLGIANLDNFEETTQFTDDAQTAAINAAVRTPLTEYCKEHGILLKRLSNYRYFMFLNEKIFSDLAADHFSILSTVRKAAQKQDVTITLSLAFARGMQSYEELDSMAARLMDLCQTRGGDQVAAQKYGEEVKYFGGSTEATEKRSRVRVRVMAHTLRELVSRSSNVIICGHRNQDFDCMGSALGMAKIAQALQKPVVIIEKTGGIEEKLQAVLNRNMDELNEEVRFVTESEAMNQLQERTLVVMVDHHNVKQSNGSKLLENAKNVAIIDHHRRATEIGVKPIFVYIEAGASSASELITELIPYISNRIELSELDATIMLAGMTIDTGHFHIRTGARTYDAASALRRSGADPVVANDYLKDSYEEFSLKANAVAASKRYEHGVVIAPVKNQILTRSLMSQIADSILNIQGVEAAFVIADDTDQETGISARSAGRVNVQMIMEKMGGGGHMTAAAVQRSKCSIDDLKQELLKQIDAYFKEASDEGNTEE